MDYDKMYKETLKSIQRLVSKGEITETIAKAICPDFVEESEDERMRKAIIQLTYKVYANTDYLTRAEQEKMLAWLEKQGEQKLMDTRPVFEIGETITDGTSTFTIVDIKDEHYLTDDGDKVCFYVAHKYYTPFKKKNHPERSEEDEKKFDECCSIIKQWQDKQDDYYFEGKFNYATWLKSLRPQKHWKPSEEQMNELKYAYIHKPYSSEVLETLYNDLKAL